MKATLTQIPQISIHPSHVNFYYQNHWDPCPPTKADTNSDYFAFVDADGNLHEEWSDKNKKFQKSTRKAGGVLSKTAYKKMNRGLDYLLLMSSEKTGTSRFSGRYFQFKIAFITLTLPSAQMHDDKTILSQCLNQFLIEIKKYYKVRNYIWRAEKQKNGNIHFHLLIDKFIPYQELRDRWNRIVEKLEYVTRYRDEQQKWHSNGFRARTELLKTWPMAKQKQAYERGAKIHWNSPNSTDIHSVQKVHNVKKYISKYVGKNESYFSIKGTNVKIQIYQSGRLWGCNRELSNVKGAQTDVDSQLEEELKKLVDDPEVYTFKDDYFSCHYISVTDLHKKGLTRLFSLFSAYMFEKFGHPMSPELL